jgi:hypothetical protein
MAAETSVDAYLPVSIVLFKLHLEFLWENLYSIFSSTPSTPTPTTSTNEEQSTIDLDSSWDLYLIAALLGLIGALYTMRRQRIALQQQPPVQAPVQ